MSQLPRKRLAAELDGSLAPAEEEDPLMASARSSIRTIISESRCGFWFPDIDAEVIKALTQCYRDDLVQEFFEALQGNSQTHTISIDVLFDNNEAIYERLGRAIGNLCRPSHLRINLLDGTAAVARAASMLTHIQQVPEVSWHFPEGPATPTDERSRDGDTSFSYLTAAFAGNKSIETVILGRRSRTSIAAGICQSMKGLLGLKVLTICGPLDAAFTAEDALSMSEVFQVVSLRDLSLNYVSFDDIEASSIFSQAIAQSALAKVDFRLSMMEHGRDHTLIPLFMTRVLTSNHLRRLRLFEVIFLDYDLAVAFCRALAGSRVPSLYLCTVQLHADTINLLGRSICSPCLEHLEAYYISDAILDSIGTSLNCAPNLQVLQLQSYTWSLRIQSYTLSSPMSENTALHVLHGCAHCPNLAELSLGCTEVWTALIDEAAAECIRHCGKLVKIRLGELNYSTINVTTSPAFLAACQAHRVAEEIGPPCRCPQLRAALALVTTKNKETRVYRSCFESLAGDRYGRAAFTRVVVKVKHKPHLIFLALTSNKQLFSG